MLLVIEGYVDDPAQYVRTQAKALAEARVLYANAFVTAKASWRGSQPLSDGTAHQMSISATEDEITVLQAELEIALWRLRNAHQPAPASH